MLPAYRVGWARGHAYQRFRGYAFVCRLLMYEGFRAARVVSRDFGPLVVLARLVLIKSFVGSTVLEVFMCLEQMGQVVRIEEGTAVVACGEMRSAVSLVLLEMEGVPVARGDWLVMHTGIAVRKISADEAAKMAADRDDAMGHQP